mmetsp:Transcript_21099/g.64898  ORF Transcript_21099/g.64898 Transcript_21099/m.64898 type:complete len:609 (+) Transcript_21099:50-1876(+)
MPPTVALLLSAAVAAAATPNVVLLMVDSMDGRVVGTGSVAQFVETPALDGLSQAGVTFENTYTPSPQCVPGRVAMLTGLRPDQTRAFDNGHGLAAEPYNGKLDANCVLYYDTDLCTSWAAESRANASLLDVASANADSFRVFGKIDLGANANARFGGNDTSADGFHNGPSLAIVTRGADVRRPTKPDPINITGEDVDDVHPEDWATIDRCVDYLNNDAAGAGSFFLHCSLNIPHPAFQTNETWLAKVNRSRVRALPPVWQVPGTVTQNSTEMHPYDVYQTMSKAVYRDFTAEEVATVRETYFAMCAEADYLLGRVVDAAAPFWNDSYVVFISDHGEMNMEHRQVWKNAFYEASARVPFIVSGGLVPSSQRGAVVSDFTSLLDVFPTVNAMLGVADPQRPAPGVVLNGVNLLPRVQGVAGAAPSADRAVVAQYHSNLGSTGAFMVRKHQWKYVRFATTNFEIFEAFAPRLFDVENDPNELHDVAAAHADVLADLEATLKAELATGANRASAGGDPEEVDRAAMRLNRDVYAKFFLDAINAAAAARRLERCAANPPSRREDPEFEAPCVVYDPSRRAAGENDVRSLLEAVYQGFDDADMAKVDAWYAAGP